MRLAIEAAIANADHATLLKFQPLFARIRGDGMLSGATWTGPRDGQQRRA
jgi:hypothetical protein